ncbi:programmed cell death protein 2-like isoform X3 [Pongo abelii]|uniref:programmed cell death protein 2-like isoform X3 n=1 Tax=Pongo abelii TaxID=9601 RepID=UPI0030041396
MAAILKRVLLGLRDAPVHGSPTGPGAWTASKLGGIPKQENSLAAEDWCEGADDWGSDTEEAPSPQLTLDFGNDASSAKNVDWTAWLQDLRLQDAVLGAAHPVPPGEQMALPPGLPLFLPYYICVADEDDYRDFVNLDHAHSLLRDYQQREGIAMDQLLSQSLPNDGDEKYEKTIIKSGDQTFYKFMKRIAACQEQILSVHFDKLTSVYTPEITTVETVNVFLSARSFLILLRKFLPTLSCAAPPVPRQPPIIFLSHLSAFPVKVYKVIWVILFFLVWFYSLRILQDSFLLHVSIVHSF